MEWTSAYEKFLNWITIQKVEKAVFQIEKHASGQLHIQAFVKTRQKVRARTLAINSNTVISGMEISAASSTGRSALETYCMKPETRVHGPWGFPEDIYMYEDLYTEPRPWQRTLETMIMHFADYRSIVWVTDRNGGAGKSQFVKKMCCFRNACMLSYAKTADLLNVVGQYTRRAYLVDLMRCKPKDIGDGDLYGALEQIKTGMILNTKYKTFFKAFKPPHVIVFANHTPILTNLSADRWKLFYINENMELVAGFAPNTGTDME